MRYSVIATVDVPGNCSIRPYALGKPWKLTEGDEQYEYDYLENDWTKGKHRKYVGFVKAKAFRALCDRWCLRYSGETMGMLGAPPCGNWAPAVALAGYDDYNPAILSVYVCPMPSTKRETATMGNDEKAFNLAAKAMREEFDLG
jgi:hypothetical protein